MWKHVACAVVLSITMEHCLADVELPLVVTNFDTKYVRGTLPAGGIWYGLYCEAIECEVKEANVSISASSAKNVLDEDEEIDVLKVEGRPIALFHGLSLKRGPVKTWFKMSNEPLGSRQYTSLQKLGRWEMPWGSKPLTMFWVKLPDHGGYRYYVKDDQLKQFLFQTAEEGHYGGDNTPIVEWVGDIDGDGKQDILLGLPDDNCGFDERLYLSSQSHNDELLHKAAQLQGREAACGC